MSYAAQRTAFVFAGGGSLGAVQVRMLHELMRADRTRPFPRIADCFLTKLGACTRRYAHSLRSFFTRIGCNRDRGLSCSK